MGTDIHLTVEVHRDGIWHHVPGDYPDDRCYDAFAILADVRNGSGFAGVKTGEGFIPISAPRGLPSDITEAARECLSDEHTPSWLSLRDLLDYDWTQTTKKQGWANATTWAKWIGWSRNHGEGPESYSGDVIGPSITHIEPEEMELLAKSRHRLHDDAIKTWDERNAHTYALATWETPYYRASRWLWAELVPILLKMANDLGGVEAADRVRIVFDFDS